uniref:Secreted protein n=1 Tax=Panagrellus redivivus TaxID=6233 RepID=A0A7E4VFU4_PANRE
MGMKLANTVVGILLVGAIEGRNLAKRQAEEVNVSESPEVAPTQIPIEVLLNITGVPPTGEPPLDGRPDENGNETRPSGPGGNRGPGGHRGGRHSSESNSREDSIEGSGAPQQGGPGGRGGRRSSESNSNESNSFEGSGFDFGSDSGSDESPESNEQGFWDIFVFNRKR